MLLDAVLLLPIEQGMVGSLGRVACCADKFGDGEQYKDSYIKGRSRRGKKTETLYSDMFWTAVCILFLSRTTDHTGI